MLEEDIHWTINSIPLSSWIKLWYLEETKTVHQCSKQPLNVNASELKPRRNAAATTEFRIREAAEVNKNELWSSLFDLFLQIGREWRKLSVINVHRNYCTWEIETLSWSYKLDQLFWTFLWDIKYFYCKERSVEK